MVTARTGIGGPRIRGRCSTRGIEDEGGGTGVSMCSELQAATACCFPASTGSIYNDI